MFKLPLKDGYDPLLNEEDYLIEDILQRSFIEGILEEQESKLSIYYIEMSTRTLNIPLPKAKKKW